MAIPIYQVDAFTSVPFRGNPAGVCVLPAPADEGWMQSAASEMNLAETAFIHREGEHWRLRWFTPRIEVDLCGHATLAAAHVLWETGRLAKDAAASFVTKSGLLSARLAGSDIEMDFPAEPAKGSEASDELLRALEIPRGEVKFAGQNRFDWLLDVGDESNVRGLDPDFRRLAEIPCRGVIVTGLAANSGFDFVSRFFAPRAGVDEDPVTGSAHCCLAPYWAERLGKSRLVGFQASPRGGIVAVVNQPGRVILIGQAVTIFAGEWSNAATPQV
jgi:PhzF family phenazine biosynthesis protein